MTVTHNGKPKKLIGVYFDYKVLKPFATIVDPTGKRIRLGTKNTPKEAALLYDIYAIQYGKETNFLKKKSSNK